MKDLSRRLMELGAHFGDTVHGHNFSTDVYVIGTRHGYCIIDVSKTILLLRFALRFVKKVSSLGGRIVMYYYNGFQFDIFTIFLHKLSKLFTLCVLNQKWIPGAISNYYSCFYDLLRELQDLNWVDARRRVSFMSLFFRILYFTSIDIPIDTTLEEQYHKSLSYWKAAVFIRHFKGYYYLPDSAVCVDAPYGSKICQEFCSMGIPVVAPVNTRSNLEYISYPIISNNTSALLSLFYLIMFSSAIREGRRSHYRKLFYSGIAIDFLKQKARRDLLFTRFTAHTKKNVFAGIGFPAILWRKKANLFVQPSRSSYVNADAMFRKTQGQVRLPEKRASRNEVVRRIVRSFEKTK